MYATFVPHLSKNGDHYGFVDEREIRIATGLMLLFTLTSLWLVLLKANYSIPLMLVSSIIIDFIIKIFIGPRFSLFGSMVRPFLQPGSEIWVGSVQKRFAWSLGLFLSSLALYCILLLGWYLSPAPGAQMAAVSDILTKTQENILSGSLIVTPMNPTIFVCLLCIIFMWLESVAGYCVGCRIYAWLVRRWWMKEHRWQNCIDGSCEVKK